MSNYVAPYAPHGTAGGYSNWGCRCRFCRAAHAAAQLRMREKRAEKLRLGLVDPQHGTLSTYLNYRCRCDECRVAKREHQRKARHDRS